MSRYPVLVYRFTSSLTAVTYGCNAFLYREPGTRAIVTFYDNDRYIYRRILLVLCRERVSAFLRRNFEPFSQCLAMRCTSRPESPPILLANPLLCPLCQGRPRPCPSRVSRACVCMGVSCLYPRLAIHTGVFFSLVRGNYLFGPCDLHMSTSGRFSRGGERSTVCRLMHERARRPALHPAGPHVRSCRDMRAVHGRCNFHTTLR